MLYRIQDPKTGLYAKGSLPGPNCDKEFSKSGKVWASNAAFAGHLAMLGNPLKYYKECVIVVIDVDNKTFTDIPFDVWYTEYLKGKAKKGK